MKVYYRVLDSWRFKPHVLSQSTTQLGSPDRPAAGGRHRELAACVRIARCAWAPAAFSTLAHSIACYYAANSKAYQTCQITMDAGVVVTICF